MSTGAETVYFANNSKKILNIQWGGEFECPLRERWWAYLQLRQEWTAG